MFFPFNRKMNRLFIRKLIYPGLAGCGLVLSGCSSPEPAANNNFAAIESLPVAPYPCEQTKGNVRVVLKKVEHATIFTADNVQGAIPRAAYPVSTMGITYEVDALGNEPVKNWNVTTDKLAIDSHVVGGETMPANIVPGSSSILGPAPGVSSRSAEQTIHIRCGTVPSGPATLTLKAGFNDETETFVFENVALN